MDVELPEEYSGSVISMLGERNGNMLEMGYRSETLPRPLPDTPRHFLDVLESGPPRRE